MKIKKIFHKVFSIGLALIVLCSTISFKVEKHFCGDALIDVAIFTDAEDCCEVVAGNNVTKKPCCKDEITVIEGQNELIVKTFDDYDFEHQIFITSFIYSYNNFFRGLSKQIIPYKNYSPPNLIIDMQTINQVFII
ncbi:HYC_CC_PP family protein [Pontimicrobium aquaticum]|uniref:Secreted protein n=1 Tax=Pontimicrobium aquaticum TaxID=2565367 RepID=A0A4U0EYL2_9FLAO|nr:hypothetical protein [Pontimicrobium aquaticum]TJY37020.1 hypothetical protein E5167_03495 [Pontimicrobium aquaticum]